MRRKYLWRGGQWVELDLNAPRPPRKAPYVMRDIGDYRSTVTGEVIGSRSEHREHLRRHDCVEVGNEFVTPQRHELPPVREDILRAEQASPETHAEAQAMLERANLAVPS